MRYINSYKTGPQIIFLPLSSATCHHSGYYNRGTWTNSFLSISEILLLLVFTHMLFLLPITLSSPLQPWKTQTHGSFLCIPTLDLLPVCPSHLVHEHHMVTLYSVCSIYCQPPHLLACPCPECSCLYHFYLCYVGLACSRCSGNGYSTRALMHIFVRTL